ncbi:NAD(P)-dependent oxidoreductase [Ralstonia solanacearum]|uniref:Epimerase n=2 Tax=Ralstonia solanacearum TaxID=305 RepID=A0A5H2Q8R7_RALSL|nr:NAD(P)H-binding protein [Ralstonia solanacearum]AEG71592.1 conserved hypothethical protein, NAD(P)-binding protein [Ralstonia solanacearum Po82]AMP71519.1 epimerase [Ralstonia solanacearum]AMP76556.1 epimerase [Ralstonia solanacearum]AYB62927.1 epimerase [Ralstonia solanacearum]EUJ12516.1 epimerase [Ralstonia solanacearum P673]
MKVVVLAATGQAGRTILSELIRRGHQVTAVARNPDKLPKSISCVRDDLASADRIAEIIAGADAVVSAFGPPKEDPRFFSDVNYTDQLASVTERAIAAVRKAGVSRLIMVGGAGSLWFSPGVTVLKSGHWPEKLVPIATSHMKAFAALRASGINWTYFSPPMLIEPGVRTGQFRLGGDDVIVDEQGKSRVSFEDYAIALVDELEKPAHERARFTIGY